MKSYDKESSEYVLCRKSLIDECKKVIDDSYAGNNVLMIVEEVIDDKNQVSLLGHFDQEFILHALETLYLADSEMFTFFVLQKAIQMRKAIEVNDTNIIDEHKTVQ